MGSLAVQQGPHSRSPPYGSGYGFRCSRPHRRQPRERIDFQLDSEGLYRKRIPRDESSLFRVVAEQVFEVQIYHTKVRAACVRFMERYRETYEPLVSGDFDDYLEEMKLEKTAGKRLEMSALSALYKREFLVYCGEHQEPESVAGKGFDKKVLLFHGGGDHYDSICSKEQLTNAGIAQAVVYEVLYGQVFGMRDAIHSYSLLMLNPGVAAATEEHQRSVPVLDSEGDQQEVSDVGQNRPLVDPAVRADYEAHGPPFPYKIVKSFQPHIYRNVAFDTWLEHKKEMNRLDNGQLCSWIYKGAYVKIKVPSKEASGKEREEYEELEGIVQGLSDRDDGSKTLYKVYLRKRGIFEDIPQEWMTEPVKSVPPPRRPVAVANIPQQTNRFLRRSDSNTAPYPTARYTNKNDRLDRPSVRPTPSRDGDRFVYARGSSSSATAGVFRGHSVPPHAQQAYGAVGGSAVSAGVSQYPPPFYSPNQSVYQFAPHGPVAVPLQPSIDGGANGVPVYSYSLLPSGYGQPYIQYLPAGTTGQYSGVVNSTVGTAVQSVPYSVPCHLYHPSIFPDVFCCSYTDPHCHSVDEPSLTQSTASDYSDLPGDPFVLRLLFNLGVATLKSYYQQANQQMQPALDIAQFYTATAYPAVFASQDGLTQPEPVTDPAPAEHRSAMVPESKTGACDGSLSAVTLTSDSSLPVVVKTGARDEPLSAAAVTSDNGVSAGGGVGKSVEVRMVSEMKTRQGDVVEDEAQPSWNSSNSSYRETPQRGAGRFSSGGVPYAHLRRSEEGESSDRNLMSSGSALPDRNVPTSPSRTPSSSSSSGGGPSRRQLSLTPTTIHSPQDIRFGGQQVALHDHGRIGDESRRLGQSEMHRPQRHPLHPHPHPHPRQYQQSGSVLPSRRMDFHQNSRGGGEKGGSGGGSGSGGGGGRWNYRQQQH